MKTPLTITRESPSAIDGRDEAPRPGLLLVFADGAPRFAVLPLEDGRLTLGRGELRGLGVDDSSVSRRHLEVQRLDVGWVVRDAGSKNGTWLDGAALDGEQCPRAPRVVRLGGSLLLFIDDVRPYERFGLKAAAGLVRGPRLLELHDQIGRSAITGTNLLISGETGVGKEVAARVFHERGPRPQGPFVAVNCASVPREIAERLLFGARRGAYSGATANADGYLQAADGGTLFLDEIAELELSVQAKLLRVLELREVLALGATRAEPVDVRVCAATPLDLQLEVARGRFREDLYFRIGRPELRIPPLRERLEEVPWLIEMALSGGDAPRPTSSATFVESCLLRAWPGNVRELLTEIRIGALAMVAADRTSLALPDLSPRAGHRVTAPTTSTAAVGIDAEAAHAASVREALALEKGNVVRAAARLGITRARLRRFIALYQIDLAAAKRA